MIELVTVMVLIGVISITIAPKFMGNSDLAEYALRDQIISAFRYAQQRAMYDQSGSCYLLNIDVGAGDLGPQRRNGAYLDPIGKVSLTGDYSDLTLIAAGNIYFDGLGNTYTSDCNIDPIDPLNPVTITINPLGLQLQVFSTGFIGKL